MAHFHETNPKIQVELVNLLYRQIKFALWAESAAAICLYVALHGAVNSYVLGTWLLCNLLFCGLARHILSFCFQHACGKNLTANAAPFWLTLFAIGALLSGVSWGIVGSLLILKNDILRQTFVVFLLIGITAAANPFYSPIRRVYALFLFTAFVPFTIWLMMQGSLYILLGLLACVYMIIMLVTSFYSYNLIYTSLKLRFEKTDLIKKLSIAKNLLEGRTKELEHQVNFDSLTGLPNRTLSIHRISQAISNAEGNGLSVAILFLDLDRFKLINDTLGHPLGDKLLKDVAKRLLGCVREGNTVARVGGDEFLIILHSLEKEAQMLEVTRRCIATINKPFLIDEYKFTITISIGISYYPRDGKDVNTLIRNADIAMYRAKELGRNNFQFFTEKMNEKVLARLTMENLLRSALEHNQFSIVYQPIVSLETFKIVAIEALLRWEHPELGEISPVEFIPVAEECGVIITIGEWALRVACAELSKWQQEGFSTLQVAVNISANQLKQVNIFDKVSEILMESKLKPNSLILELTETIIMDDIEKNIVILNKMKEIGIQLVIDDFGIGYSSLNYLKKLPIDKIKIDRSFVADMLFQKDDAAITIAMIALANKLQMKVVAEGVENEQQIEFLIKNYCNEGQGYYFSKPLSAKDCAKLLRANQVLPIKRLMQSGSE